LKKGISEDRRKQIVNGFKNYFPAPQNLVLDVEEIQAALRGSLVLFQIYVGVLGAISFSLAFFLLLIQTTRNKRES